jgi:lysophospholipase L1-like esterase
MRRDEVKLRLTKKAEVMLSAKSVLRIVPVSCAAVTATWLICSHLLKEVETKLDRVLEYSRLLSPADMGHARTDIRTYVINSHLLQAQEPPIVIVGDSITEGAFLPTTICGQTVINAGIGGMTPDSYATLIKAKGLLSGMAAHILVVALGTNNAQKLTSEVEFESSYREVLSLLEPHTEKLILAGIPQIENGPLAQYFDLARIDKINTTIETVADQQALRFIPLAASPIPTRDGVHPTPLGYKLWLRSITAVLQQELHCAPSAAAN